jgi:hypothetical protein
MEPEQQEQVDQNYPRVMYRGDADLKAAENVSAEEHIIVHNDDEKVAALKDGYRLNLVEKKPKSEKEHDKK